MSCTERLARIPGLGAILRARYDRLARTSERWRFYGVFESYQAALEAQPRPSDLPEGYQAPGIAKLGEEDYGTMHSFDYPVVFWLRELLEGTGEAGGPSPPRVVDLGGHLGEKRNVWGQFVPAVERAKWTVCETADAVAEATGRGLASGNLRFTSDPESADGADVLVASGSLQYLPYSMTQVLSRLESPPSVLLFNKVPLSTGPSFWTLQNLGHTSVPYRVFNNEEFLTELAALGYEVRDRWEVPPLFARVPFRPGLGTDVNSGVLLRRSE